MLRQLGTRKRRAEPANLAPIRPENHHAAMLGMRGECVSVPKRVLVALDRSPELPPFWLSNGVSIALRATGAEVYLFHAVGGPRRATARKPSAFLRTMSSTSCASMPRSTSRKRLPRRSIPSVVVHVLVRIGAPWSAICQAARENDVDLVVIGSHGYDALDHVLGTTAAKVVNHSDRSVLVVRDR